MLFDQVRELPVATLRSQRLTAADHWEHGVASVKRWCAARWRWFRPRTVPVVVAFVGTLAMLHAVNYLSQPPAAAASLGGASTSGWIHIDGTPYRDGKPLGDLPTSGYRVRLVLHQ